MLARHIILNYPEFYKIFGETEFTWNKIRQHNRNPLLGMLIGADGLKTGFTKEAGYGLVGSAVQNGMRLIVVVNGAKTAKERADEAKKLLEWGFRNFEQRVLFARRRRRRQRQGLWRRRRPACRCVADGPVTIMVPKSRRRAADRAHRLSRAGAGAGQSRASRSARSKSGATTTWCCKQPLHAADGVGKGNLSQRAFDAVSELVIALFRAGAQRL